MESIQIKIQHITDQFQDILLPEYATEGSSGLDLRAAVETEMKIEKGKVGLVPTNLKVEIPIGYELQVRPRSGLSAKNGIGVLNSPGTIDSDYRGEIKVILFNFSDEDFIIKRGDRIAQMVVSKV
ncbi:MAG: dUTP diphosphatase, partial [Bacteroidota bacterium]